MLLLTQSGWDSQSVRESLEPVLKAASKEVRRRTFFEYDGALLLLPHAGNSGNGYPSEASVVSGLASLAEEYGVYLAASCAVQGDGAARTVACLFDPEGATLLRSEKITPDFVSGFSDTTSALGIANAFKVAETPFGKVGLLPGEDILIGQYARSLAFNGAELILNPSAERSDRFFDARKNSRFGRASENIVCVATASPATLIDGEEEISLPRATGFYTHNRQYPIADNETFFFPDYDVNALRRVRLNPGPTMPAIVRADVYAVGYHKEVKERELRPAPTSRKGWLEETRLRLEEHEARAVKSSAEAHEEQYGALLIQQIPRLVPLTDNVDAQEIIAKNLDSALDLAASRAAMPSMRLVVFPEFWLTGPGGIGGVQRTPKLFGSMAISNPGPVFEKVAAFAEKYKVYVAFQNFEMHKAFPDHVFNTAFLMDDSGKLIQTHRKIQDADIWGLFPTTTPGSVLDKFLDVFGPEELFSVVDTPIGRLANMVCFEVMFPEIARGLAKAGAEVILHSSSEPHGTGRAGWSNCRTLRASENTAAVLSAIDGGEIDPYDGEAMTFFRRGFTQAVNFDGHVYGVCDGPGPVAFRTDIDLAAIRRARRDPRANIALWDDAAVYAHHYANDVGMPSNLWTGDPLENPYLGARQIVDRIQDYLKRGVYTKPFEVNNAAAANIPDIM